MTLVDVGHGLQIAEQRDPRNPWLRLEALCDENPLRPLHNTAGSGVVTAVGRIDSGAAVVFATDPTVQGGALGSEGCRAIADAYDVAIRERIPVVGIWHSGGARLAEGVASLHGVGEIFA